MELESIEKRIKEKYNYQKQNETKFPKKNLLVEVTNICNNKCIFCANRKMTREKNNIDLNFAKKTLKDCYNAGCREVGFYATGEPLLYPNLDILIARAKEIGYQYIYLTTNGLLAKKEKIQHLLQAGLDSIKFSINAINKKDYKFIHGVDFFDVVINNLKSTFDLKQTYKFNLFVSYIATKYTNYSKKKIENFFGKYCDSVIVQCAKNQGGYLPLINKFLKCDNDDTKIVNPCSYVMNSITITCEGYLTCCCMDFQNYLVYADLNKISVKEAWNNATISNFRKRHLNGDLSNTLCDSCINNKCKNILPLSKNLCTIIDNSFFRDDNDLEKRINEYLKKK